MAADAALGVILAGGLARRMGGGDKALRLIGGVTLLDRVIARAAPQVSGLWLNANGDPARFARWGLPVVPDDVPGAPGPLAGILAALDWAAATRPEVDFVASFPCDAPFIPRDLVARLAAARREEGAQIAVAASGGRIHPVAALWPVALRHDLRRALVEEGIRKVERWAGRHGFAVADFAGDPVDPFLNGNTPEDLQEAERLLAAHPELA
ncbi:molybdenum cofactor guanylyltransferase MobA [Inquilinus limosus]|uniref:Molybdenum cofactor guanylyltransferase n=1 Tax=Inquilinus limosus TaxID=171674 RepID=A0A211ZIY8_9PROT|nr:molybdenum cofactor guanylyltransferase MobA [Inquilinus limosus]OWJ65221.1 molybdenum cofactor guanylyltransferase MobA [Inquilinus limosus]